MTSSKVAAAVLGAGMAGVLGRIVGEFHTVGIKDGQPLLDAFHDVVMNVSVWHAHMVYLVSTWREIMRA